MTSRIEQNELLLVYKTKLFPLTPKYVVILLLLARLGSPNFGSATVGVKRKLVKSAVGEEFQLEKLSN